MNKWDARFMGLARLVASWSKDPGRKVGAVIVVPSKRRLSVGYNGPPRGTNDEAWDLELKEERLDFTVHAELNAILNADFPLEGCAMYVADNFPCHECAKAIVQAGIRRVVAGRRVDVHHPTWGDSWDKAIRIFCEAGIRWVILEEADIAG